MCGGRAAAPVQVKHLNETRMVAVAHGCGLFAVEPAVIKQGRFPTGVYVLPLQPPKITLCYPS